jgi:hypothetical protein
MRNTIVIVLICLGTLLGCSKDKFTTKPQVTFKKANANVFGTLQTMQFIIGFTDAEGDFTSPGKVFIQRINPTCAADSNFKDSLPLPDFPSSSNFEGDIKMTYSFGGNNGQAPIMTAPPGDCGDTSTCYFRFAVMDKAGNRSDTVNSGTIILINN